MNDSANDRVDFNYDTSVTATCPKCPRAETLENSQLAQAWLTGHILEEHAGQLPELEGTK